LNQQRPFDLEYKPFVGLIIGPYTTASKYQAELQIFHMNGRVPYQLKEKFMPCSSLPKSMLEELKQLFNGLWYSQNDRINIKQKWGSNNGSSGGTTSLPNH